MIVHLVTDRRRLAGSARLEDARRCLLQQVAFAVDARVDCIIVRERDLDARGLADLTTDVVRLTRGTATRVVVNDRVDIALAARADGVHLRGDSIAPETVRRITPARFLIGRSVHGAEEAASVTGADYLIAGTVWPTVSKPEDHHWLGLNGLTAVVEAVDVPVLAIGGVALDRIHDVSLAGAAGIAAIGLFMGDANHQCRAVRLDAIVKELRAEFDTSGSRS